MSVESSSEEESSEEENWKSRSGRQVTQDSRMSSTSVGYKVRGRRRYGSCPYLQDSVVVHCSQIPVSVVIATCTCFTWVKCGALLPVILELRALCGSTTPVWLSDQFWQILRPDEKDSCLVGGFIPGKYQALA